MELRSRLVLGAAVAAMLTGCGASPSSTPSTTPSASPLSSPSVTPTGTASTAATPSASALGPAVAIGNGMSVDVPGGWQVIRGPVYADAQSDTSVCLHQPGDTRIVFGCAGIALDYGKHLSGGPGNQPYVPNVQDGWYRATDVQPCPFGPAPTAGKLDGIRPQPGFSQGLRPVGDHHAYWNQWKATCDSGESFRPQAWFLPTSRVLIFDYIGHSATNSVLASARFASDGATLPAMPTYLTAHLFGESGPTMIVQQFTTYLDNGLAEGVVEGVDDGLAPQPVSMAATAAPRTSRDLSSTTTTSMSSSGRSGSSRWTRARRASATSCSPDRMTISSRCRAAPSAATRV
jgi:hypothetical protein